MAVSLRHLASAIFSRQRRSRAGATGGGVDVADVFEELHRGLNPVVVESPWEVVSAATGVVNLIVIDVVVVSEEVRRRVLASVDIMRSCDDDDDDDTDAG